MSKTLKIFLLIIGVITIPVAFYVANKKKWDERIEQLMNWKVGRNYVYDSYIDLGRNLDSSTRDCVTLYSRWFRLKLDRLNNNKSRVRVWFNLLRLPDSEEDLAVDISSALYMMFVKKVDQERVKFYEA